MTVFTKLTPSYICGDDAAKPEHVIELQDAINAAEATSDDLQGYWDQLEELPQGPETGLHLDNFNLTTELDVSITAGDDLSFFVTDSLYFDAPDMDASGCELTAKKSIFNQTTASRTLSATWGNYVIKCSLATGTAFTLPALSAAGGYGSNWGMEVEFVFPVSVAGGTTTITASAGDFFIGGLHAIDTDSSNALTFDRPNHSSNRIITLNGSTQGGLIGTRIKVLPITDTHWQVHGENMYSGAFTTVFSG